MFEFTARQRFAAFVLLFFLALGGTLIFISHASDNTIVLRDEGLPDKISVYVCGAVAKPGLITLKPGSRVDEAIKKAGGALPEADLNQVNLAAFLEDGEQIYLVQKGEELPLAMRKNKNGKSSRKTTPKEVKPAGPFDLNLVTQKQLESIPGIGPSLAQKIIQYRNEHGKFADYEALLNVSGVGESKLEKFRSFLYVK